MSDLFKDKYNKEFFGELTEGLEKTVLHFNSAKFLREIYDTEWNSRELKQRMRHISTCLKNHLSDNYQKSTEQLQSLIIYFQNKGVTEKSLEFMFIPDFIELYGVEHYEVSVNAIEHITKFTSCEFAIRPFIIRYEKEIMRQMLTWAKHPHYAIRRLSSEGCRPRLPWAMALPALKEDPKLILPILEELKSDSSESVRRSVANNLNDISKDNPDIVVQTAIKWQGLSKETDWVIKHACRTLLKQGNKEAMQLFGFGSIEQVELANFRIETKKVKVGNNLEFSFRLLNQSNKSKKIRLEYGIYYKKANGTLSRKVFKISEKLYAQKSETKINRKQAFKIITTRKFYPGKHKLSLIINGNEMEAKEFELTV
jgi:3-methyladenine DNA glycosylase AlkC